MKKKIKDTIFLTSSRIADITTTYLCLNLFGNDLSTEGGPFSRLLLQNWGFPGLVILNILIIFLLFLVYDKFKKLRIGWIMRVVAWVSLIFATYNLLVYLSALKVI